MDFLDEVEKAEEDVRSEVSKVNFKVYFHCKIM